ncbi:MAG: HAD-IC family P-type ATPase, partial [Candidatus Falkowbacteria bacterium]|nr:HAD-IC family P-type ATPase [Candidatus Falkowbacteria bacterium]
MGLFQPKNHKRNINSVKENQILDFDYISSSTEVIFEKLKTLKGGLTEQEAWYRLERYGYNEPLKKKKKNVLIQILLKFFNPLVIVLLVIAVFSFLFGGENGKISALIIIVMAVMSVLLSFIQEYRAGKEIEKLNEMIHTTATVYRNGQPKEIKIKEIVLGDIVELFAGDMIPADLRIFSCKDLFINQASLTGESFPVEKVSTPIIPENNSISESRNIAFMGSSVVSGAALGIVIKTSIFTKFGELSQKLTGTSIETSFEKGIRDFTLLMVRAMFFMVCFIFAINALRRGSFIESLLFSLGVAVGLTPEMLPMIVTINLSKGAIAMSKKKVIVKRLSSIQNFGAMDILCTDKTGT